ALAYARWKRQSVKLYFSIFKVLQIVNNRFKSPSPWCIKLSLLCPVLLHVEQITLKQFRCFTTSPASTSHPTPASTFPHTAAGQYPSLPLSTQNSISFHLGNLSEYIETEQELRRPSDSPRHVPEVSLVFAYQICILRVIALKKSLL